MVTGVGNVSRLQRFVNDTRDALALVFQPSRFVGCSLLALTPPAAHYSSVTTSYYIKYCIDPFFMHHQLLESVLHCYNMHQCVYVDRGQQVYVCYISRSGDCLCMYVHLMYSDRYYI